MVTSMNNNKNKKQTVGTSLFPWTKLKKMSTAAADKSDFQEITISENFLITPKTIYQSQLLPLPTSFDQVTFEDVLVSIKSNLTPVHCDDSSFDIVSFDDVLSPVCSSEEHLLGKKEYSEDCSESLEVSSLLPLFVSRG